MRQYSNFQTQVILGIFKLGIAGVGLLVTLGINLVFLVIKGIFTLGHCVLK